MRTRVKAMVEPLAREHQQEWAALGTLVDWEQLGLPLTSSHIESTIKQINRRVKGSEKFWSPSTGEAVLQLRADYLGDSAPLDSFWLRHQARQTGVNTYSQTT